MCIRDRSISWNSCDGFASALSSFVGQNYGAKKIDRINKSTRYALIGVIPVSYTHLWYEYISRL